MTHNFIDISPTLICNRRTIRVHEDVACELSLLSGKSSSLWISSSPVQPLQAHLESMEEKARSSSSAISCWIVANSFVAGADIERPYTTLPRSFAPGVGLPVSPRYALFCVPPQICEAARTAGSSDRWSLLSLNRRPWVLYLMALKPCHQNRAVFLDPLLFPGREEIS